MTQDLVAKRARYRLKIRERMVIIEQALLHGLKQGVGNFVFVSHTTEPERLGGQYGNGQERGSDRR
jgi:hypothetical protein